MIRSKLVIDNYPEGQVEYLTAANNLENEALGNTTRFRSGRELYIEQRRFHGRAAEEIFPSCSRAMKYV